MVGISSGFVLQLDQLDSDDGKAVLHFASQRLKFPPSVLATTAGTES